MVDSLTGVNCEQQTAYETQTSFDRRPVEAGNQLCPDATGYLIIKGCRHFLLCVLFQSEDSWITGSEQIAEGVGIHLFTWQSEFNCLS